jgi:thiol-disulfide isomerase/thioredoxin
LYVKPANFFNLPQLILPITVINHYLCGQILKIYFMKKNIAKIIFLGMIAVTFSACLKFQNPYSVLPPGVWRGVLKLEQREIPLKTHSAKLNADPKAKFEEVTKGELPFNFEVVYDSQEKFHIDLINAGERIRLDDISIGRNKRTARDTIRINFPEYQSYITAEFVGGVMQGFFKIPAKGDYSIPFEARYGQSHRFSTLNKTPVLDMTGNWETTFGVEGAEADQEKAIGQFKQEGNKLTGTFATETGDYRFLEGEILANKMYLSCFDGAHAFLFEGKILEDKTIFGTFQSGKSSKTTWEAKKNDTYKLRDAEKLVQTKTGVSEANINFTNPEGKVISLQNAEYQGKVKILQIMGTWCPNCKDETKFLSEFSKNNPNVAVIGLAFERHKEKSKADLAISNYKKVMKAPYEFAVAGYADKKEASEVLPFLDKVMAFPTTVYIDKHNKIRKIYTGFYGPATQEHAAYKADFEAYVKNLEAEK